ncbi:DUF58 domain-containing protein [Microbacteriaceae bacterium 4G12]
MKRTYSYHRLAEPYVMLFIAIIFVLLFLFTEWFFVNAILVSYLLMMSSAHLYVRLSSKFVYHFSQKQLRLFIRDTARLQLVIQNHSKLPVINASFRFRTESGARWSHEKVENIGKEYKIPLRLQPQEEKEIDIKIEAIQRGKVTCEEVGWTISDLFNLVTLHITADVHDFPVLYVYPRLSKQKVPVPKKVNVGFRKVKVSPLYDETKIVGIKSYENESFRSIHWGATAKIGQVSAKKYAPSQIDSYTIYLNVTNQNGFTFRRDLEELIEYTAGVCYDLVGNHCSFELWINCLREKGIIHIPYGRGRKQLQAVLQLLSTLTESENVFPPNFFFSSGMLRKTPGAIPLIIGNAPPLTKQYQLRLDVQGV